MTEQQSMALTGPSQHRTGQNAKHDSAEKHVTGQARYIDDVSEPKSCLHVAVGGSKFAHARLKSINLDKVRTAPGVCGVITAQDVPGEIDIGPVF
ncbi:MAG: hypothetical protein MI864_26380, partial [Pseudomonadales bacterium]|nr:hypothetical protein [Pseudomonadales bacterium]